jgi:DNA-binding transcriptional LysR family regulator
MATIDLELLTRFVAVVEAASFSAAAKRLALPKSSVSRGVARLERSMGVKLLHRTTRRVAVSTAGAALYERAAPLLAELQRSIGALPEQAAQPSGRLRVAAKVDFGAMVLAEIVARFVARYPAVEVDMRLSNQIVDLVAEGIDVAFRFSRRPIADASWTARRLGTYALQLFASPAYLARRGTPRHPRELDEHTGVRFRGGPTLRLTGPGEPHPLRTPGSIVGDDMWFVREALRAGAGVGLLPGFIADPEVASGQLVRVLPRWAVETGSLWLVSQAGRHVPSKVAVFREFVIEALRGSALTQG